MSESGEEGEEDEEEGDDVPQEAAPDDGEGSEFDELQVGSRSPTHAGADTVSPPAKWACRRRGVTPLPCVVVLAG